MDSGETIRRRIIDQAVALFARDNPNQGGLFTTAHYGQAMKAEFKTHVASAICDEHLEAMADVEPAGSCLWRRLPQEGDSGTKIRYVEHPDTTLPDAQAGAIERAKAILQIGSGWLARWYRTICVKNSVEANEFRRRSVGVP